MCVGIANENGWGAQELGLGIGREDVQAGMDMDESEVVPRREARCVDYGILCGYSLNTYEC